AARWLVAKMSVDSTRIGMYGGSYGGVITVMALFTKPGVFAAGAALRPVTDWAHYNHGHTARIPNQPQDDSVAYRQSSPIYFAQGLPGPRAGERPGHQHAAVVPGRDRHGAGESGEGIPQIVLECDLDGRADRHEGKRRGRLHGEGQVRRRRVEREDRGQPRAGPGRRVEEPGPLRIRRS